MARRQHKPKAGAPGDYWKYDRIQRNVGWVTKLKCNAFGHRFYRETRFGQTILYQCDRCGAPYDWRRR